MPPLAGKYRIHSLNSRSDLLLALEHHKDTLKQPWPPFFHGSPTLRTYLPRLIDYTGLLRYQYAMVWQSHTGQETIVAHARSVPFYWPELDDFHRVQAPTTTTTTTTIPLEAEDEPCPLNTLPDGGYETILSRAVEQFFVRQGLPAMAPPLTHDQVQDMSVRRRHEAPNALAVLGVVVNPDWRGQGIVGRMVEHLKSVAGKEALGAVVVPLRPAGKVLFPTVEVSGYLGWRKETGPQGVCESMGMVSSVEDRGGVPFDPALRKHVSMGGRVVKVAGSSISVMRDIAAWEGWTRLDIRRLVESETEDAEVDLHKFQGFVEVCIPGALVPVRYYPKGERLVYCEPNVWVYHAVT